MTADESPETRLTVGDIVRRWDQSATTVRRHMATNTLRGAGQVGRGFWSAPVESVIALYGPEPVHAEPADVDGLVAQLGELTAQRDAALHRIDVLEAIRAGQADTIAALRLALSIKVLTDSSIAADDARVVGSLEVTAD